MLVRQADEHLGGGLIARLQVDLREGDVAQSVVTVNVHRAAEVLAGQEVALTDGHGNVAPPGKSHQPQRVLSRLLSVDVPADGTDPHQGDLGGEHQVAQTQGVVDSGVAVVVDRTDLIVGHTNHSLFECAAQFGGRARKVARPSGWR